MLKLPTRRLADYRRMRIEKENPEGKDKGYNYYYDGKLYINNTKNKREMVQDIRGGGYDNEVNRGIAGGNEIYNKRGGDVRTSEVIKDIRGNNEGNLRDEIQCEGHKEDKCDGVI